MVSFKGGRSIWFAAELELGKQSKDGKKSKVSEDGRERDFRKLLNCTAAVKLFVCRVQRRDPIPQDYCEALAKLVAAHGKLLAKRGTKNPCLFGIVVLPTTAGKWKETCLTVIARGLEGNESVERKKYFQAMTSRQLNAVGRQNKGTGNDDILTKPLIGQSCVQRGQNELRPLRENRLASATKTRLIWESV